MKLPDSILLTALALGIEQPHQSTVDAILRGARQGLFTEVEADLMIDRVRTHVSRFPVAGRMV